MLGGTAEVSNTGDNFFLLFIQIYSPFASFLLSWLACLLPHKQAIAIDTKEETKKKEVDTKEKEDARGDGRGKQYGG